MPEGQIPVVRWTKKGLVICPVCNTVVGDPRDGRRNELGRDKAVICKSLETGKFHVFQITAEAAIEINKIWDRLNGVDKGISRDFIKNIEEPLEPNDDDSKNGDR